MHGSQLKVETRGGHPSIGFWDKPEEWVSWNKVKITKPGIYEISAEVSSAKGETEITVEVAGQQVSAKTPKTANWDDFKSFTIGKIEIKQAGEYDIKVRARAAANWKPIGLAWIALNLSK
ncbi:MAG: carbohydrate-binding protein [Candidatus Sumerlaeota bacterium]|nr:carbohydrate-binding protein [Candidatus Sumerlaeota bacterium]